MIHWEGKSDVAAELVGAADSVFDEQQDCT